MNVLITGGSSGLGGATMAAFARDKSNFVYFTYANSSAIANKLEEKYSNTVAIKCNFENLEEVNSLVKRIDEMDLDILINNAFSGNPVRAVFNKIDIKDFTNEFLVNVIPIILITQASINIFRKKRRGRIITILTSGLTNKPPLGSSSYIAVKAYIGSLVKSWATENARFNITSNSISPAFMVTDLTSDLDERIVEQLILNHPLKKLLTVEEVAETILFISKGSSHINGVDITLNSGVDIK